MSNKKILQVVELTVEELYEKGKDYNPSEWRSIIDRLQKYTNIKFFLAPKDDLYQYDRFFAEYTISEGIRFLKSVCYSSSITNASFVLVQREGNEIFKVEGVRYMNTPDIRKIMSEMSLNGGAVFTNEF